MKNLKQFIVLVVLSLLAINCNKEEPALEKLEAKVPNFSAAAYSSEEISEITSSINKRIETIWNSIEAKETDQTFWVNEESAIGVRDSIGNMTYSFRMYVQNSSANSVYNLVVQRRVDGNNSADFVMKYKFESQDNLYSDQKEDKKFHGKIDVYSFNSFLNTMGQSSKEIEPDPCYDDIGTNPTPISTDSSGSGSGTGSGGGDSGTSYNTGTQSTPGSTAWSSVGTVTYSSSDGGGDKVGTVEVGEGCFCEPKPEDNALKSITGKIGDCPEGEMLIAINTEEKVKLLDAETNPCVKEIIEKLQQKDFQKLTIPDIGGLSGTGHLTQGILDLFDSSANFNLIFRVAEAGIDNSGNHRNATTKKTLGVNEWIVTLDDDYVRNGTSLAIARTIIHESTHAFLGYVLKKNPTSDVSVSLREYYNILGDPNMTEHTFMTQYIEAIGHSLSVWDNNRLPEGYYNDLAWSGGMLSTKAFNELSSDKKISIEKANTAEGSAIDRASTNALGTKCN
jgi:hypothetical protein